MKRSAFILVFPFLLFLAETTSFIPGMKEACTIAATNKNTCAKKEAQGICNTKKTTSSCCKTPQQNKCQDKKDASKEPAGKGCENSSDCTNCPVCYTFIFQPQYEITAAPVYFTKNYGTLQANYTSTYTPSVWKPPNGLLNAS